MSSPPFFLRDSRASEMQARVKITPTVPEEKWGTTHSLGFSCLFVGNWGNHTYKLQTWINQVRIKWCLPSNEVINFPLQFFEFILLFLQTKCQEFGKAMKKIAGCVIVVKKEQECGVNAPFSRPCFLWKPVWQTDQQLLFLTLAGCNFSLCLCLCCCNFKKIMIM